MKKNTLITIFLIGIIFLMGDIPGECQEIPFPVSNYGVYDFLDELANIQVVSINSAVKPYSRLYIAKKLQEADEKERPVVGKATEGA